MQVNPYYGGTLGAPVVEKTEQKPEPEKTAELKIDGLAKNYAKKLGYCYGTKQFMAAARGFFAGYTFAGKSPHETGKSVTELLETYDAETDLKEVCTEAAYLESQLSEIYSRARREGFLAYLLNRDPGKNGGESAENESALDPLAAEVTREAESFADKLFKRNHKATRHLVVEGFVQGYVVAGRFEWPGRAYFEECVQRFGVIRDEAETFSGLDFETHDGKSYLVGLRGGFLYRAIGVHYLEYFWHWMEQQGESAMPEPDPKPETESTEEINPNEWQSEALSLAYELVNHGRELLAGVKYLAEVMEADQALITLLAQAQKEFLRAEGMICEIDTEHGNKLP